MNNLRTSPWPFLALAALLAGCVTSGTKFTFDQVHRIQVGMTEAEVLQIMPQPLAKKARPDGSEAWVWAYDNGFRVKLASLIFANKKVIDVSDRVLDKAGLMRLKEEGEQHWRDYTQDQERQEFQAQESRRQKQERQEAAAFEMKHDAEQKAREDYAARSDVPPPIAQAIRNQQIILDMTTGEVLLSWGNPRSKTTSVNAAGTFESWFYSNRDTSLSFVNGILESWTQTSGQ